MACLHAMYSVSAALRTSMRRGSTLAAQMIEEVMYDQELRVESSPQGREWEQRSSANRSRIGFAHGTELRPPHSLGDG